MNRNSHAMNCGGLVVERPSKSREVKGSRYVRSEVHFSKTQSDG